MKPLSNPRPLRAADLPIDTRQGHLRVLFLLGLLDDDDDYVWYQEQERFTQSIGGDVDTQVWWQYVVQPSGERPPGVPILPGCQFRPDTQAALASLLQAVRER